MLDGFKQLNESPGLTYPSADAQARLDFIYLSSGLMSWTATIPILDSIAIFDHLPVCATIFLPEFTSKNLHKIRETSIKKNRRPKTDKKKCINDTVGML